MSSTDMFCNLVPSNQGHLKLIVNGYLLTKNKNRGDVYYWCCEKRKSLNCNGYASIILADGKYKLKKTKAHNHTPDAAKKDIAHVRAAIKKKLVNPEILLYR